MSLIRFDMTEHYLDNAATTKPCDSAVAIIDQVLREDWGNPSSLHHKGQTAEKYIIDARRKIASILLADPETIYFTSGATESTNTAVQGAVYRGRHRGRHILITAGEHAATYETCKRLEEDGYEVETIENDGSGRILLEDLEAKLRQDTVLVSMIHVNNEIGTIQPVEEAGKLIHKKVPECLFHVDATQSFAKLPIFPTTYEIDLLSASAHKINGPKGIGLLYIKRGLTLPSLIVGGGQEKHFRSGTENVPYIAGFGTAATEMWESHSVLWNQWEEQKKLLLDSIQEVPGIFVNGPSLEEGVPYITSIRVEDVRSEVLLHALEDDGVYISSGSACSSNKPGEKSRPLASLGLNAKEIDESLRVSFGRYTLDEDITAFAASLKKTIPLLRRFVRK